MICEQQVQRGHRADLRFEKPTQVVATPPPSGGGGSPNLSACILARAHLRTPAGPIPYEKPYEIERSVDYDEHYTVLVVIEDLSKCFFFVMTFTCPCPTMYTHMDAAMV